ncbi:MAG: hypothetical protein H7301_01775 [Cryobacterium sp.]|nr:hypothetical protein [Oligoflexia bacterium]
MRFFFALSILALSLALGFTGCSKTPQSEKSASSQTVISDKIPKNVTAGCAASDQELLLSGVAAQESAKNRIEKYAKSNPAKENFKRLYTIQTMLTRTTNETLAKFRECGKLVPDATIFDLQEKLNKAQDDLDYLVESFPEFRS